MVAQIKAVIEPEDKERGLYVLTMIDENCNEWTAHVTKVGYEIIQLKEEFVRMGYDLEKIEEFEDKIREETYNERDE